MKPVNNYKVTFRFVCWNCSRTETKEIWQYKDVKRPICDCGKLMYHAKREKQIMKYNLIIIYIWLFILTIMIFCNLDLIIDKGILIDRIVDVLDKIT